MLRIAKLNVMVLLLFFPIILFAEGKIVGTVSDCETNEPIANVYIFIDDNETTVTNNSGWFELTDVENGTHTIRFSRIGYHSKEKQVIVKNNKVKLNVALRVKAIELKEMVITATRTETPISQIGSSVSVINAEEIERRKENEIVNLIKDVPGIDVVQNGGLGQLATVSIRGAYPRHTLVMIDGVGINDPINPNRECDLSNITTYNIDRIEIVRGSQSVLYGSDAVGGVINILTKRGLTNANGYFSISGGTYNTFYENGGISGKADNFSYSLDISHQSTDGISVAGEKYGNKEKDSYKNTTILTNIGFHPVDNFVVNLYTRWNKAKSDLDNKGGFYGDDPNYKFDGEQMLFKIQPELSILNNKWHQKLGISFTRHKRNYKNDKDVDHPNDSSNGNYKGNTVNLDWQNDFRIHSHNLLTVGFDFTEERGKSDYNSQSAWGPFTSIFDKKLARTTGIYVQDQLGIRDYFYTSIGIRNDYHTDFGWQTTYRIAPVFLIHKTNTRIKGTYGTGFKSPSLYQLYSEYGNSDLKPEKSESWDIGLEQSLFNEKVLLNVCYFSNIFNDLIDFDFSTWKYSNIAEAESKGIECSGRMQVLPDLSIKANCTYLKTEDKTTGEQLLRKPKRKFSIASNYRFLQRGNVNLEAIFIGYRYDRDFATYPPERLILGNYTLLNMAISYDIINNLQLYVKGDNLTDKKYENVYGYGTSGVSVQIGMKTSVNF